MLFPFLIYYGRATAITEQQARDALLAFVSENFCFGKKAARDMDVKDVAPSSAYHVSDLSLKVAFQGLSSVRNL